jgi:hypothetical protein
MAGVLLMLGIGVAAGGVAAIGFGIPINEFTLGNTLILAGTTALAGGLILIGLSAAVTELRRVAEALRTRTTGRPVSRAAEALEPVSPAATAVTPFAPTMAIAPAARPPQPNIPVQPRPRAEAPAREAARTSEAYTAGSSAVEVSAAAIERLRSSIPRTERSRNEPSEVANNEEVPLSPNGAAHVASPQHQAKHPRASTAEPVSTETNLAEQDRPGGAAVEALKASRLDFLFRSKPARPAPQPENFDTVWPADARPGSNAPAQSEPQSRIDQIERRMDAPGPDRRAEPTASDTPRQAAILKSGVVDGMAYTLYADGSIEAKLPHGTVRFGSIAELRTHIESNS